MKSIISLVLRYIPRPYLQLVGHWAARGLSIFYIGNKVECPVCNSKYRKFLPYGRNTSSRENALCPSCLSLERHRLMALYMKRKTIEILIILFLVGGVISVQFFFSIS